MRKDLGDDANNVEAIADGWWRGEMIRAIYPQIGQITQRRERVCWVIRSLVV